MAAKCRYNPQEQEVCRILYGYAARKRILCALENERSILGRRILEAAQNPARAAQLPLLPGGFSWQKSSRQALDRELEQLVREQQVFLELTGALDPIERQIIRLRHEEEKCWSAVGVKVYMSERQAQRIYREAIRKMSVVGRQRNLLTSC